MKTITLKIVIMSFINQNPFSLLQVKDVLLIHQLICPNYNPNGKIQLSCDGVSETKSTTVSLDVYLIKFINCKNIYPLRIIRPLKKVNIDHKVQLKLVIDDIHENNLEIAQIIGDNPKRANAKCTLCHSSWFPCEYCCCKGTKIVTNDSEIIRKKKNIEVEKKIVSEKIAGLKKLPVTSSIRTELTTLQRLGKDLTDATNKLKPKKSNIVWPKTSANGPQRTIEQIRDIIEKIENDQIITPDEAKGITGRSPLFDIPYFNYVRDVPVDYLHCCCLGVVKRCVELTFKVGEVRQRETKRPLSSPLQFNQLISRIKVTKESNRRVRDLDFAVYKGQEFRNLALFFFPIILNCIERNHKERNMWLHLSYLMRSCVLPKEEFRAVPLNVIDDSCRKFYSYYQQLFGVRNCTYNTQVFSCHLIEMRYHGPLTFTSAFPFESFYGELRRAFVPGTVSTLKQIMSNVLIKRTITKHSCIQDIYISEKDTSMECNSLIYCFSDLKYRLYQVQSIDGNRLLCKKKFKHCHVPLMKHQT